MDKDRLDAIEAVKKMSFKEKIKNYWEYYKIHTIVGIFILLMLVFTVRECAMRVKPDVSVAYISSKIYIEDSVLANLEDALSEYIDDINNDGKKVVSINSIVFDFEEMNEQSMAMSQKLQLEIAAGESTLYIVDGDMLELLDGSYEGVVAESAPISGDLLFEQFGIENQLYAVRRVVYQKDQNDQKKLMEYDNAMKIYDELTKEK